MRRQRFRGGLQAATLAELAYTSTPAGRHSSVVEQLFRKQQVLGSSPSVGSTSTRCCDWSVWAVPHLVLLPLPREPGRRKV